jgi:hypothetical protein
MAHAQDVAVRIGPASQGCFPVMVKNLRTTSVKLNASYLAIFDQESCKVICKFKIPLTKKLLPCETFRFRICCKEAFPPKYISYVLVAHSSGRNEAWSFQP